MFLREAARRLFAAWARDEQPGGVSILHDAIRAVEVHRPTFEATRAEVLKDVQDYGVESAAASALVDAWLICDDFLLAPLPGGFHAVVGNPPYVRHELIPKPLLERYRADYASVYDRADLYVPFIERGLEVLRKGGRLSYICADRWMKNKYGGPLRNLVADRYWVKNVVGLHGAEAFEGDVDAYPSVFTIERPCGEITPKTVVASNPPLTRDRLTALANELEAGQGDGVRALTSVASGSEPWLLDGGDALDVLRAIEARFPKLEAVGCRAGIGVATGADRVFIASAEDLPIEPSRVLPLAMAKDARTDGTMEWSGRALANPFEANGSLVDLDDYPRLRAYFKTHGEVLRRRHVARKSPSRWYRTIDKVHMALAARPKLLIPDIKGSAVVAYDDGTLYPHHNLYVVTSEAWEVRALQAVLRSRVAEFQVACYAVRMRGGYLRFQAQYLRRIRLPAWGDVSASLQKRLADAATGERADCDAVARELYGLSDADWGTIEAETAG